MTDNNFIGFGIPFLAWLAAIWFRLGRIADALETRNRAEGRPKDATE